QPAGAAPGAARPRPRRAGGAASARPRGAGPAPPRAALGRGGRRRAGADRRGRQDPPPAGAAAPARTFGGRRPAMRPGLAGDWAAGCDPALEALVEEYTNRLNAGEDLDAERFAAAHPGHAAELGQLLPALRVLAELSGPSAEGGRPVEAGPEAPALLGDYRI